MLMYFNRGPRTFEKTPTDVALRYNWEFYAVLKGKAAPYFSAQEKLSPSTASLWLIPPRRKYSWWSDGKRADRVVFHFSTIDESMQLLVGNRDYLRISLDKEKMERIRQIADNVEPHYQCLTPLSPLYFSKALAELSLLVAENIPTDEVKTLNTKNQVIAHRALAYYESQLPRRPLIDEVARSAGVSSTHIRRIFNEVFQMPPKRLFLMAQFERSKRLAAGSDLLIDEIARRCGFSSAAHFCSLFAKYNHITFSKWRTQLGSLRRIPHLRSTAFTHVMENTPRKYI